MGYGMQGHLGWCFQTAFGSSSVNSVHYVPILSESMKEDIPPIVSDAFRGRLDVGDMYEGAHNVAGDINMESHPIYTGLPLKGWCGQSSGTLVESHYSHVFKPVTSDPNQNYAVPPATIEIDRKAAATQSSHLYYDCCVDALNIEIAQGEIVKMTASMIGTGFELLGDLTPSYEPGSNFVWSQASVSVSGSGVGTAKSISLNFNNNLEAVHLLNGTKTAARILRTSTRTIETTLNVLFDNNLLFDAWRAQSIFPAVIVLTGQEVSSGYNSELIIDLPSLRTTAYDVNLNGVGQIEATITAQAEYNTGSGTMVQFTLVNTQSIY